MLLNNIFSCSCTVYHRSKGKILLLGLNFFVSAKNFRPRSNLAFHKVLTLYQATQYFRPADNKINVTQNVKIVPGMVAKKIEKEFADNNFKFDENGRKLSKRIENTVGNEEIACYEQFLLFPQCFQKTCSADK